MKKLFPVILLFAAAHSHAQADLPRGFKKGNLILSDSSRISGYVKEFMSERGYIVFRSAAGSGNKIYGSQDLSSVEIGSARFVCLKGDFFRVISEGELVLLQKYGDASALPVYNGSEAIFLDGTPGRKNDYFIYDNGRRELTLVKKKNLKDLASNVFHGYGPSMDLASSSRAEIPALKKAVELYNTRITK